MLDYERCDVYPYKGEMWVRLYLPWLTAQEKKILKKYYVRDEGRAYVVEGPKKFLKNFCKTP